MKRLLFLAVVSLAPCFAPSARAEDDAKGCKDHPAVKRFPNSYIRECSQKDFDEAEMAVALGDDALATKKMEGQVTLIEYETSENTSSLEIARNYENAFKSAGVKAVFNGRLGPIRYLTGALSRGGSQTWIAFAISDRRTHLTIVKLKSMEQKVEVAPADLFDQLGANGRVPVYGINFEIGTATLTPDSDKVLSTVLALLKDHAALKLRVEGHTDNLGKAEDNLSLSKKRAEAIKGWLIDRGIPQDRLATDGMGDTKPVGDNSTEEGKAKNRRVELVRP
jgi:OOP family OmpA-OmpF porin